MEKNTYKILSGFTENQIPIFISSSLDEMGVMVGFDGDIEQVEQFCNFTYHGSGNTITIYNTVNTTKLKTLVDSIFSISWGDGEPDTELPMTRISDQYLSSTSHTFLYGGYYDILITINSPWGVNKLKRRISSPFIVNTFPTDFGVLSFTVPYSNPELIIDQQYLEDYRELTGNTNNSHISFLAIGKSRLGELKNYGLSNTYSGITISSNESGTYTGYTIDSLYYMDYDGGYTHITGNTSSFIDEVEYDGMISRNEHLIGFIDEPSIYSDIFVERGRQGIMERNLRLSEIESTGELEIYGSGFFNVIKQ